LTDIDVNDSIIYMMAKDEIEEGDLHSQQDGKGFYDRYEPKEQLGR